MDRADGQKLCESVGQTVSLMIISSDSKATVKMPVGFVIDLTAELLAATPIQENWCD